MKTPPKPLTTLLSRRVRSVNEINYPINKNELPQILFISSYPPRECGIATYTEDLIDVMNAKFHHSFELKICALENENEKHTYTNKNVDYILDTSEKDSFDEAAAEINENDKIKLVVIQHEFGFYVKKEKEFVAFLAKLKKPVTIVFHTVLPNPNELFKQNVLDILDHVSSVVVMTQNASQLLIRDYGVAEADITIIPHGTHLVAHTDREELKAKYGFQGRKILSTFGLLGPGKSIETTLNALPAIIKEQPEVLFLIIGKTHPTLMKEEGELYRNKLEGIVASLGLEKNVKFINEYVKLEALLEYLQLTDIYLFTSKDPNQAVSGTFSYAMSCGCPIISTPIPHAKEMLDGNTGILIDFDQPEQLATAVNRLLSNPELRKNIIVNGLHKIAPTAWENAAVAHAKLFQRLANKKQPGNIQLHYRNPEINLAHLKKMTTDFGMLQFSKINHPDLESGYTLDDNARAMIAVGQHFKLTLDNRDLEYLSTYLNFIEFCQQPDGSFLNYVDIDKQFTDQNGDDNLSDSNGRAIWALGYLASLTDIIPEDMSIKAKILFHKSLGRLNEMHSPRAMAFAIKGLYYYNRDEEIVEVINYTRLLADRLVQMYRHVSVSDWMWFESYLTYANSVLPEAVLCAYAITTDAVYKEVAKESFDFLLKNTFSETGIKVISNRSWHIKGEEKEDFGEQPIDVAYTIMALRKFHDIFKEPSYLEKMEIAFNWFLGNNHLSQIIYNPCTGGCYDGLEEKSVNLNQGAESTISYLIARLSINKHLSNQEEVEHPQSELEMSKTKKRKQKLFAPK